MGNTQSQENLKYMGIHSHKQDGTPKNINIPSDDPRRLHKGTNQFIWEVVPQVMDHVEQFKKTLNGTTLYYHTEKVYKAYRPPIPSSPDEKLSYSYKKIPSLLFVSYNNNAEDIRVVQNLINQSFYVNPVKDPQESHPSTKFQLNSRLKRRGYSKEYAQEYINEHVKLAKEYQDKQQLTEAHPRLRGQSPASDIQKKDLSLLTKRTCDNVHGNVGGYPKFIASESAPLLLQDILIEKDKKQLVFLNMPYDEPYKDIHNLIIEPFVNVQDYLGDYVWSLRYNKAITRCAVDNDDDMLFPLRFVLFRHLNHLFFDNKTNFLKNHYTEYIGFFLVRYNNKDPNMTDVLKNIGISDKDDCFNVFKFEIKLSESTEPYFVMFVFKNTDPTKANYPLWVRYMPINYKCNRVEWGDIGDARRTLYIELMQIMCMNIRNEAFFYVLLEKTNDEEKKLKLKDIKSYCESVTNEYCVNASFESKFYDLLIDNDILPFSIENNTYVLDGITQQKNEVHLLVSKKKQEDMFKSFKTKNTPKTFKGVNCNYIEFEHKNKKYVLIPCHLDWKQDPNERLVICMDDMSQDNKKVYDISNSFCIPKDCSHKLDNRRRLHQILYTTPLKDQVFDENNKFLPELSSQIPESFHDPFKELQKGGSLTSHKKELENIVKQYDELQATHGNIIQYNHPYLTNGKSNFIEIPQDKKNFTNILPITTNIKNKSIYYDGKIIGRTDKIITPRLHLYYMLSIFPQINLQKILIIASNTHIVENCLLLDNNHITKITLCIINTHYLNDFMSLKEKYKDLIDVYYIGSNFDYVTYEAIRDIVRNTKYSSVVLDYSDTNKILNGNELSSALAILLMNTYLDETMGGNCFINYNYLPIEEDNMMALHNIAYNCFHTHNFHDLYQYRYHTRNRSSMFIFNNMKQHLSKSDEKMLIDFLKADGSNELQTVYNKEFLNNMDMRWSKILTLYKENFERIKHMVTKKAKRFSYQRNTLKTSTVLTQKKIPEIIEDIPYLANYNDDALDHQSKCHWGQKKLLLSEIQFFTRVCKSLNTKSLKDYAVIYIGSAAGNHLPILYNMFPDLIWLLYDPAPFSKEVMKHPTKDKSVFVYNMFFTDDTLAHVRKNVQGRKILFISDIRVEPKEEDIIKDMRNQAYWATELNADFMLFKFRIPYENLQSIAKSNAQLKLDEKLLNNPKFSTDKDNHMVYLKGDVYLQIFPPPYSGELRLYVEKNKGKYDLSEYDYNNIEKRLVNFNSYIRPLFNCYQDDEICRDMPLDYISMIPGFDTSIECLMEYNVVKDYFEYFFGITDKVKLTQKLFDMNFLLEKLAYRKFITCSYDTTIKYLKRTNPNNADRYQKMSMWRDVSKMNIELSAKRQYDYISKHGKEVLGQDRYNQALKYLKEFITDRTYIKL